MTGLTTEGFEPETYDSISARIKSKLEALSPGFDFSVENPDGQILEILSLEIAQAWAELDQVYYSFDPNTASGQAIRNLGLITGIPFGEANASLATIDLIGTAGTIVPIQSIVAKADGTEFITTMEAVIPSSVQVIAVEDGPVPVGAGSIVDIVTPITGWTSISQPAAGVEGTTTQTESEYRNLRNRTVMSPASSVTDALLAQLLLIGLVQVDIKNNDSTSTLADGTPPQHIHVTVAESPVTDQVIADTILKYKSFGTPTYGSTTIASIDSQGESHDISFTKALPVEVFVDIQVKFLSEDFAGAVDSIKEAVAESINALLAGEDVVWSRLFSAITPYGKAQVDQLLIGKSLGTLGAANIALAATEYAFTELANIQVTIN